MPKEPGAQFSGSCSFHSASPDASGLTAKSIAGRLGTSQPEAVVVVVVPVVRPVVVTVDRPDVNGIVVPAPTAYHAVRPRGRARTVHYYGN